MFIIYPQKNNKLAVLTLTGELSLEETIKKDVPTTEYAILSKLNADDLFFDAYEYQNKQAVVNITKAKEIWLSHYRTARTPLLADLDVSFMRSVEAGDAVLQKEIASKKQALRDVTKTDLPNTLEEIKATWPEVLGTNPFNK